MDPIQPTPRAGYLPITWAKDQPEYRPLPSLVNKEGRVLTEWVLTDAERAAVALGANLTLTQLTYGTALQPLLPQIVGAS